jgi:Tol biopolymer transport system component
VELRPAPHAGIEGGSNMNLRPHFRRISRLLGGVGALLLAAAHAPGQAVVTRVTGDQPWRAASGPSDSAWFPERNEMAISRDSRWVVFESDARNLVLYERNVRCDVFAFEVATGRIVGITSNGTFNANHQCYDPAISGDGRFVVFASSASNLVANDTNSNNDVFLIDRDPDGNGIFDEQGSNFERISVGSRGNETHGDSASPCISDDGMRILFVSEADDVVANDTNGVNDAFLLDRKTGKVERIDVDSNGNEADSGCGLADLSADGKVAAFFSYSDNLVPSDVNGVPDVFIRDIGAGSTEIASVASDGTRGNLPSFVYRHCLSSDGTIVAFQSFSTNLDVDTNGWTDVFVHDRSNDVTKLVSVDSNGAQGNYDSGRPTISADGTRVTFASWADNFAAGDGNGTPDVFLRDLAAGTTTLLSGAAGGGATSNGSSAEATISADGTLVAFSSDASDLVLTTDTAGYRDVFLADLTAGTVRYVSAVPAGEANGPSMTADANYGEYPVVLSMNGRYIGFQSEATNLVPSDGNGVLDVFVADRISGELVRASVSTGGDEANGPSAFPALSDDGRFVVFASNATNLIASDANGAIEDIFLRDRDPDGNGVMDEGNATTTMVSVDSSGQQSAVYGSQRPSISADGKRIAFMSSGLVPNTTSGIYVHDMDTGVTEIVDVVDQTTQQGNGASSFPTISADGISVAFQTYASDLDPFVSDYYVGLSVWVHRTDDGTTQWVAGGTFWAHNAYCIQPSLSADGRRVTCNDTRYGERWLAVDEMPSRIRTFTRDDALVTTAMSPGGRTLSIHTLSSHSPNDTNGGSDVYLIDLVQDEAGAVSAFSDPILVSKSRTGAAGNGWSIYSSPSADGNLVAFASDASDLVAADTNGCRDVFLYDRTHVARWLNYGSGFAYPHAIPHLTSSAAPVLGSTITLDFGNSSGIPVAALVFMGWNPANDVLPWGATFLVDLSIATSFLVPLGASGGTLTGTVPSDPSLDGISLYLQALEADAAVPRKLSFTPGLELHIGQ